MQRTRSVNSVHRPLSRASTQSAHSPAPELLDLKYAPNAYMNANPEAALMHYGNPQSGRIESAMLQQTLQAQHLAASMGEQYPGQSQHFMPQDNSYLFQSNEYGVPMQMPTFPHVNGAEPEERRRKGSSATATNDKELRELLVKNENRGLQEVAQEVIQKERTPQAEKTKQLFAMLWLRKVCKTAKTSVPRNRVYSHYATRCGTERVVPLNPASFGKLVRVIFPGIQTRRLGVRGESKYHYVDLCLVDDDQGQATGRSTPFNLDQPDRRSVSVNPQIDFGAMPHLPADTAAFPPNNDTAPERPSSPQPETRGPPSQGRLFAYPDTRGMNADDDGAIMYEQTLRFPGKEDAPFQENDSIALPDIHPFCPPKTDSDTAEALTALYRTHCTSLIDCIRFCKEKQFFRLFTSFHGTLTVPVQKLLAHPNLAPWIQACDTLMYQKMVRFVSRLTLQAAPPVVITILNNISTNLHAHISKTFSSHPSHVLQAKLKPAATFSSLLHRLIRVNASAHAAANLLTIDQNREQMWREWVSMVNPKRVMEAELPSCGYEEVYKIMTCDIRGLLEPLNSPPFPDNALFSYDNQAYGYAQGGFANVFQNNTVLSEQTSQVSTENVLDRWSAFLSSLPSRFPRAKTRTLLQCISAVGTAALRDITIMGGASYQTWWVMKIFVDEMALWLAEMGGFLDSNPSDHTPATTTAEVSPVQNDGFGNSMNSMRSGTGSRTCSMEADFAASQGMNSQGQLTRPTSATMTRPQSMQSMHSSYNHPSFDMTSQHNQQTMQQHLQQQFAMQPPHHHHHHHHQHHLSISSQQPAQLQTHNLPMQSSQDSGDIDDSGIGMSLMDDDLTLAKFGITGAHVGQEGFVGADMSVNVL
ncbi:hypothetical protein MBLNU459_g5256t1 [Dothideomycetes sp. NU459]